MWIPSYKSSISLRMLILSSLSFDRIFFYSFSTIFPMMSVFKEILWFFISALKGYLEFLMKLSASRMSFLSVLVLGKWKATYDFDAFLLCMRSNKEYYPYNQVHNIQYLETLQYGILPFNTQDIQCFSSQYLSLLF